METYQRETMKKSIQIFGKLFIANYANYKHLSSLCKDPDEWNSDMNFLVKSPCDVS